MKLKVIQGQLSFSEKNIINKNKNKEAVALSDNEILEDFKKVRSWSLKSNWICEKQNVLWKKSA